MPAKIDFFLSIKAEKNVYAPADKGGEPAVMVNMMFSVDCHLAHQDSDETWTHQSVADRLAKNKPDHIIYSIAGNFGEQRGWLRSCQYQSKELGAAY
ncbi:hypothetical protein [Atopomonas sediminilitoris]|uniref:hypothetical protein n=1 Tax=Atopomonas sediminilitoris TaxID=2919919 RepID=UPI001F4DF910|nr:hypothetical protein [Atopomonas sediminilitoris]MCJ8170779.1 hypothetical protein [Atopomonas sediminilitoris]